MYPDKPSSAQEHGGPGRLLTKALLRLRPPGQFFGLAILGLVGVILLSAAGLGGSPPLPLAVGAGLFTGAMGVGMLAFMRSYPHHMVGWCNAATVFRLMLVSVLASWLFDTPQTPWAAVGLATVAFALDGLDGWLARREGYASDFGARFDMEVDSIFAMVLALLAYRTGLVGWYVLLLGLPRYLFFCAQFVLPWLNKDLPPRFSRKVVCVLQIAVLILILLPILPATVAKLLTIAVLAVLGWSFWIDIRWLGRSR